ncbi:hypothetical protein [Streptomyces tubercidicus]
MERQRIRAEIQLLRAAHQIVESHAARCKRLYDPPHIDHPTTV